ncbi:hypothetical protein [Pontibacter chinhatensis]|uniref:Uncharacterized protein n=1 Tax=Pontibacter chinhatensis TaxID=1436961 RepID=A0A1I2N6F6_9BACT|nr:hypothetical protein [Pontibacter chinhatensis]SFF99505.1 hypothetical protein SAMN05421739_101622 [Pontibacter chinhatensis]
MIRKLNWQVFTEQERNKAIEDLKGKISSHGGYIVNSTFFSDLAISLTIEIEENDILKLYASIQESMTISESGFDNLNVNAGNEWWIFLNVTFRQGKGDLKIDVPNVPG